MTADALVTLVWMAPDAPDGDQARALASWARARGVRLEPPRADSPRPIALDASADARVGEEVERLLDRVRDAIAARDAEVADRSMAAAESALRAHPELPQASWLMAEVERARSARFRRVPPLDEEAADRAWARAEALDAGRLAGVGERAAAAHPANATVTLEPSLAGATGATVWLDGRAVPVPGGVLTTRAGPHTVVVTWNDAPVWASWVEAPAGSSALQLGIAPAAPCSTGDVSLARLVSGTVEAAQVRCGAWVTAVPGARPSSVLVATCEAGRCGALLEWSAPKPALWTWLPPPDRGTGGLPTWATWGLVGAGAVIATGVVLVASGALQSAPTETRFVGGGIKQR